MEFKIDDIIVETKIDKIELEFETIEFFEFISRLFTTSFVGHFSNAPPSRMR
jgi:hypothetical protein